MAKKPSRWENIKGHALTKAGSAGLTGWTLLEALQHMGAFKEGGRVRGVGKAKRGFGRAMRKK
jgi:hypothetical protein